MILSFQRTDRCAGPCLTEKKKQGPEGKPLFEVELRTYRGENLRDDGAECDFVEKLGS